MAKKIIETLKRFIRDEGAPTATEYAIIASGIALVLFGAGTYLASRIAQGFNDAANSIR